ncbi:MAG: hypothetical protein HND48_13330 [Chloroflexi bacterium]|nr:hypothetical protein [Chloroflexota bacterium]GIK28858.1 MAG: hypothetical protein BroJett007_19960 [Chloroflexota bacterium]
MNRHGGRFAAGAPITQEMRGGPRVLLNPNHEEQKLAGREQNDEANQTTQQRSGASSTWTEATVTAQNTDAMTATTPSARTTILTNLSAQ